VLTGCADEELGDIEPLMTLLRRSRPRRRAKGAHVLATSWWRTTRRAAYGQHLIAA